MKIIFFDFRELNVRLVMVDFRVCKKSKPLIQVFMSKKKKKKLRCNALKVGTPLQHCQIAGTSLSKEYRGERETCHAAVI